jgi:hypothetical protein
LKKVVLSPQSTLMDTEHKKERKILNLKDTKTWREFVT